MLSFRDSGKKENMPYISWASASTGRQKIKEKGGDFLGVFVFMDQICNGIYITSAHIPLAKIQSHGLNGKKKMLGNCSPAICTGGKEGKRN